MKTAEKELLKLWLFEVAMPYGSHFEKMALKDFVTKPPEVFQRNMSDKNEVRYAGVLQGYKYVLFSETSVISHNTGIFYFWVGALKPSF